MDISQGHRWIAVTMLGSVFVTASIEKTSAQLPDNFFLKTIAIASNDNLLGGRISCAFGDAPKVMARLVGRNTRAKDLVPDTMRYCVEVLRETAKRKLQGNLYSRMQPGTPVDEWNLVVKAAWGNKREYVNASGVIKELNCELAFDAGYVYGLRYPERKLGAPQPDHVLKRYASRCFDKQNGWSNQDVFLAGVTTAQQDQRK